MPSFIFRYDTSFVLASNISVFVQNDVEKWSCGECTQRNDVSTNKCIACGAKKESPKAELSTIEEEINSDDDKIATLSVEVKNYSISGKGKRLKRN